MLISFLVIGPQASKYGHLHHSHNVERLLTGVPEQMAFQNRIFDRIKNPASFALNRVSLALAVFVKRPQAVTQIGADEK
ncbi:MAG: hypothetical protein PHQ60_05375 [Sideroxydans sp.]|nr:hypothetical protein [Sideroxydans sp.]